MPFPHETARRRLLALLALSPLPLAARANEGEPTIEVWKSPTCGCCTDWARYLDDNGLRARLRVTSKPEEVGRRHGIADRYRSCHTGLIDGYAIEGHVPVREIKRLLAERPDAAGLAVPGMPIGSPGMDGPAYQGRRDPYAVYLIGKDGSASVYATYP